MSKNILSVSYDASLLATRQMLLEMAGYTVISALGFAPAREHCNGSAYDLFILGHSIPTKDKEELIRVFREHCSAPVLSLERWGEMRVESEFHASPDDPEKLLKTVRQIFGFMDGSSARKADEEGSQSSV